MVPLMTSIRAQTSIRDGTSLTPTPNDPPMKQEFAFGAEYMTPTSLSCETLLTSIVFLTRASRLQSSNVNPPHPAPRLNRAQLDLRLYTALCMLPSCQAGISETRHQIGWSQVRTPASLRAFEHKRHRSRAGLPRPHQHPRMAMGFKRTMILATLWTDNRIPLPHRRHGALRP